MKICILGVSGSGKTTLSEKLGKELNIPVYHLDTIFYTGPHGKRPITEIDSLIHNILQQEEWIIEGKPLQYGDLLIQSCTDLYILHVGLLQSLCNIIVREWDRRKDRTWKERINWFPETIRIKIQMYFRQKKEIQRLQQINSHIIIHHLHIDYHNKGE